VATKKGNARRRINIVYILLSFIILFLLLIIAYIGGYFHGEASSNVTNGSSVESPNTPTNQFSQHSGEQNNPYQTNSPADQSTPSQTTPSVSTNPLTDGSTASDNASASHSQSGDAGTLYIVLDDVGNSLADLDDFLDLPMEITFAIMPQRQFSTEAANRIHKIGREIIIHQPMEPVGNSDPGKGALFTWMDKDDILKTLKLNKITVPYAVGMNNHMGSKATLDRDVMTTLLNYLKGQNMFFLDSKTITGVVGGEISATIDIKYLQRNAMFLDNEKDQKSIESAIRVGMQKATRSGHAVMIGHVMTTELADALLKMYPEILDEGYEFDRLSQYFTGEDDE